MSTCPSAEVLTNEADSQRILQLIDLKARITGMGKGINTSVQWRNVSSGGLREVRLQLTNMFYLKFQMLDSGEVWKGCMENKSKPSEFIVTN